MEPIKFMSYRNGRWLLNCAVINGKLAIEINPENDDCVDVHIDGATKYFYYDWAKYKVFDSPLYLFTTAHDSEGQEIYAGHRVEIVSFECLYHHRQGTIICNKKNLQWCVDIDDRCSVPLSYYDDNNMKIIGHIATGWPEGKGEDDE